MPRRVHGSWFPYGFVVWLACCAVNASAQELTSELENRLQIALEALPTGSTGSQAALQHPAGRRAGNPSAQVEAEYEAQDLVSRILPPIVPGSGSLAEGLTFAERLEPAVRLHALELARLRRQDARGELRSVDPGLAADGVARLPDLGPFSRVRFHYRAEIETPGGRSPGLVAWFETGDDQADRDLVRIVIPVDGYTRIDTSEDHQMLARVPRLVISGSILHVLRNGNWQELANPWNAERRVKKRRRRSPIKYCDATCSSPSRTLGWPP